MSPFTFEPKDRIWQDSYAGGCYFIHAYPRGDGSLYSAGETVNCREFFTMSYQRAICDGQNDKNINLTAKAYALITTGARRHTESKTNSTFNERMALSLHMINSLEKHYKRPITRLYLVKSEYFSDLVYFIGSKRWTQSRYSIGLWTLFMKLTFTNFAGTTVKRNILLKMDWPDLLHCVNEHKNMSGMLNQARSVFPKVDTFFAFEKKHLNSDREANWNPSLVSNGMQRPEGIQKLVSGYSNAISFKQKWNDFLPEYKKQQRRRDEMVQKQKESTDKAV